MTDISFTATLAAVPVNALGVVPDITITRLDTGADVVSAAAMTDTTANGKYTFNFASIPGLNYSFLIDADPTPSGQVDRRFFDGAFSGNDDALTYEGAVWYDSVNGEAGTAWPVGTRSRPSNDEASTRTIADFYGIKTIMLSDTFVLDQSYIGFTFEAVEGGGSVDGSGEDAGGSIFNAVGITGIFTSTSDMFGTAMQFFGAVTGWRGVAVRPGMSGSIEVAPGETLTIAQGASTVAGVLTPSIDVSGVGTELNLRAYSGGITIENMDNAGSNATLEFTAGQVILSNNTLGTIVIRGQVAPITDDDAGATIVTSAATRGFQLNELYQFRGADIASPKTVTENTSKLDYDEVVDGKTISHVKVAGVTTSTRS